MTDKANALAGNFQGADLEVFKAESDKVVAGWKTGLACSDTDPETGKMNVRCRQIKLMSCRQAWVEIGPEGSAIPGLLDLSLADR